MDLPLPLARAFDRVLGQSLHHKAIWDYWPNVRSGYRIQIEGTGAPEAG